MKKFLLPALAATLLLAATAVATPLDAFKGMKGTLDIAQEAAAVRDVILCKMGQLRLACDEAETLTPKKYWPFPTYGDLLFGVR